MTGFRTDWLFTGEEEPIRDGLLIIDAGRIKYAGPRQKQPFDVDLPSCLIIPGLVNTHTHLDLGELKKLGDRGQGADQPFTQWLKTVIYYRRNSTSEGRTGAIHNSIKESLSSGTTLLADISVDGESLPALQEAKIRSVIFLEILGLSNDAASAAREKAQEWLGKNELTKAVDRASEKMRLGISPHAPYSIHRKVLQEICELAHLKQAPLAMHIAETPEELQLIQRREGPFRAFLEELGVWHPENLIDSLEQAISYCGQSPFPLLVHGNCLSDEQIKKLPPRMSVVYCPRTHNRFSQQPHPYKTMLECKINVALGTDSLASNPDLSILHEARFLWQRDKNRLLQPNTLLAMATINGAKALGFGEAVGTLERGKYADFVVLPCTDPKSDPWEQLWESTTQPLAVFIAGEEMPMGNVIHSTGC